MVQSIINNIPLLRSVLGNQQAGGQQNSTTADEAGQAKTGAASVQADDQVEISQEAVQRFEQASTLSEEQVQQTLAETRNALAENEGVTLGLEEEPA